MGVKNVFVVVLVDLFPGRVSVRLGLDRFCSRVASGRDGGTQVINTLFSLIDVNQNIAKLTFRHVIWFGHLLVDKRFETRYEFTTCIL